MVSPISFHENTLTIIDQRLLPTEKREVVLESFEDVAQAIETLAVRGAPLIGISAAYGVYLGVKDSPASSYEELQQTVSHVIERLARTRPTAVNLFWALDRMKKLINIERDASVPELIEKIRTLAIQIHEEDRSMCESIGNYGKSLIKNNAGAVLTICNAGSLATGGIGTALAPMYQAAKDGVTFPIFSMETRPLLQGSRLTTWELMQAGLDVTLITDNMVGYVFKEKTIQLVITGADRIASNGDTANKIGTLSLALVASQFGIPFYVAAPSSTFDPKIETGNEIPIEERDADEVRKLQNQYTAPPNAKVLNPAFDVTPNRYITGFITEYGIISPSFREHIPQTLRWK